jgi:BlaI family penicillinase repressor
MGKFTRHFLPKFLCLQRFPDVSPSAVDSITFVRALQVHLLLKEIAMTERPALSKGELEVARVLWDLNRATVREVHEAFPEDRNIDFTTVQTYLRRLESKGYVKATLQGRTRVYSPKVKPRTVIRETIDDLVDRLFGGESFPLVQHLIEDGGMSDDEVEQLRGLLGRLKEDRDDESSE